MITTAVKRAMRYLMIRNAVKHANRMSATLHREHFVLQINNRIRVYDEHKVKRMIFDGFIKQSLKDIEVLRRVCIYTTYNKNKKEPLCTSAKKTS